MSDLGDIRGASAEFYNSLVALIDRRIEARKVVEAAGVMVREEKPVIFEEEERLVVWAGDPEGTVEAVVTGKPQNRNMVIGDVKGVVSDVWVPLGIPDLVKQKVAVKPSIDPDRPGWELVGTYGRKGGRIA